MAWERRTLIKDRVWASGSSEMPVTETVKQPTKVMVWDIMNFLGLSDLHIVPRGTTATSASVEEMLEWTAVSAIR